MSGERDNLDDTPLEWFTAKRGASNVQFLVSRDYAVADSLMHLDPKRADSSTVQNLAGIIMDDISVVERTLRQGSR